jgi:hypothetical protein
MLVAAVLRWPDKKFADDNECDACWLWQYAHDNVATPEKRSTNP